MFQLLVPIMLMQIKLMREMRLMTSVGTAPFPNQVLVVMTLSQMISVKNRSIWQEEKLMS